MKVIQVYKPLQDQNTKVGDLELVEFITKTKGDCTTQHLTPFQFIQKKIPYWCVMSEMLKPNETFQEWLKRKKEVIEYTQKHSRSVRELEGIYFYDIQPIVQTVCGEVGMVVRYDYIYKNSLR